MAQLHKMNMQTPIMSHPDKIFDIYKNKTHLMPMISPDKLRSIEVLEGDGNGVGSVRLWTYVRDGKVSVAKDMVEAMDEEKKSITYKVIEGDVLKLYKDFRMTLHVDTNGDDSIVTWTMDYEKVKENVPDPKTLMDYFLQITKDLDAHTYGLLPPNQQRY